MIDTHTHLYLSDFAPDGGGAAAVRRALDAGISHMVFPNVDRSTIEPLETLAGDFQDAVSTAMGLHPTEIGISWRDDLQFILNHIESHPGRFCAIGEIGMDLYWDKTFADEQMKALDIQLSLAARLGLPAIIHCREALPQTIEVLKGHPDVRVVFHSFGGSADDVDAIRRTGDHYFGINGIVTFKNSSLRHTLPAIGLKRILTETDAPYLAPVPYRGKRNESAYIVEVGRAIAAAMDVDFGTVDSVTTRNALDFFKI